MVDGQVAVEILDDVLDLQERRHSEPGLEAGVGARHQAAQSRWTAQSGATHLLQVGRRQEHGRVAGHLGLDELLRGQRSGWRRRPCWSGWPCTSGRRM